MSIDDDVLDRCNRGMLYPLVPLAPGVTIRRAMLICEALHAELNSPEGDDEWEERIGNLQADLEHFITSAQIHSSYLFLLYPSRDCVWEIRSVKESPSMRVLGLFAYRDTFVATNMAKRSDLGGWQSREWKTVKRAARATWNALFYVYPPLNSTDIHTIVSGAIDGKFLK